MSIDSACRSRRKRRRSGIVLAAALLLFCACAEIAPPPGGPEDKTPPFVFASEPADGAVNVPLTDEITIFFSEYVVPPSSDVPVYISPRQSKPPRVIWKPDRLHIHLADSLAPDQSYYIAVAADIRDLRNNALDSSTIVAFSTGATLAAGVVSGAVDDNGAPPTKALVALYRETPQLDSIPFDSLYPDYLAPVNRSGSFRVNYLPLDSYRLIAFVDRNGDERANRSRETYGITVEPVEVDTAFPMPPLHITLSEHTGDSLLVESSAFGTDGVLRLRFSRAVDIGPVVTDRSLLRLTSLADARVVDPAAIQVPLERLTTTAAAFFGTLEPGDYRVSLETEGTVVYDTVAVQSGEDRRTPRLAASSPAAYPQFLENLIIGLVFDEIIDTSATTDSTFRLVRPAEDSLSLPLEVEWRSPFGARFTSPALDAGERYRIEIRDSEIRDLAGNRYGDSTSSLSIVTVDPDSLGVAVGNIRVRNPRDASFPVGLVFTNVATQQLHEKFSRTNEFSVELPAGRYILEGFIDRDGDNRRGYGSLEPWQYAEPYVRLADTVQVRPRFETAGYIVSFE